MALTVGRSSSLAGQQGIAGPDFRDGYSLEEIYDAMQDGADDECYECGGEGWIVEDCFEDTCCCEDPECDHDIIPCLVCNPSGKR